MKVSNRFSVSTQDQFNDIFIVVKLTIGLRVVKSIWFVTFENILNFNKSDKTHDFGQILKSEKKILSRTSGTNFLQLLLAYDVMPQRCFE